MKIYSELKCCGKGEGEVVEMIERLQNSMQVKYSKPPEYKE